METFCVLCGITIGYLIQRQRVKELGKFQTRHCELKDSIKYALRQDMESRNHGETYSSRLNSLIFLLRLEVGLNPRKEDEE